MAATPKGLVETHRCGLVVGAWILTLLALFALLVWRTSAPGTAAVFSVLMIAAASVLLVPALWCLVCACDRLEVAVRDRRTTGFRACREYREALGRFTQTKRRRHRGPAWFASVGRLEMAVEVSARFTARGSDVTVVPDPDALGFDLLVREGDRTVLVRCVPGDEPVPPRIGREMAACVVDHRADLAVIATVAPLEESLLEYIRGRPIARLDPSGPDLSGLAQAG